jgi:hypothetical protein
MSRTRRLTATALTALVLVGGAALPSSAALTTAPGKGTIESTDSHASIVCRVFPLFCG